MMQDRAKIAQELNNLPKMLEPLKIKVFGLRSISDGRGLRWMRAWSSGFLEARVLKDSSSVLGTPFTYQGDLADCRQRSLLAT